MQFSIDLSGDERIRQWPGLIRRLAPRLTKLAAQEWTEEVQDWISAGKAFKGRTGALQQSVSWAPRGDAAEVFAQTNYAGYVEGGTRAHLIRPRNRKALKIPVAGGGFILRRAVNHPGSRPYPFMWADVPGRTERLTRTLLADVARQFAGGDQ